MGKLKSAVAATALTVIDYAIDTIPDPALKAQLKTLSFIVKVPYAFLKELYPSETDEFLKDVLVNKKIINVVIKSSEFQQALGNTLQNMAYAREKEKREIIKKVFINAYISQDEYAKNSMEKLQDVAQQISIPALQHLMFFKKEILPRRDRDLDGEMVRILALPGFSSRELKEFKKRTKIISYYYDSWYQEQAKYAETQMMATGLSGAREQKLRLKFMEYWTEYNSLGIFRQGNDPTIGTVGGGGGTVQYLTEFGERFLQYIEAVSAISPD